MPDSLDLRGKIADALGAFATRLFFEAATGLFDALGYRSQRRMKLRSPDAQGFLGTFDRAKTINPERALLPDWQSVEFLFQLTDAEVLSAALGSDELPFDSKGTWDGAKGESHDHRTPA